MLHPCRDLVLKGVEGPLPAYLGVCVGWCVLAFTQSMFTGAGLTLDPEAWGLAAISAGGLAVYYFGTLEALKGGHLSVYYPIIRSSPLAIVALNWGLFGQSYSAAVLFGILLIVVSGILLQRSGAALFENGRSLLLALAAMMASAVYALADAAAMKIADPATFVFWVYLVVCALLATVVLTGSAPPAEAIAGIARSWTRAPWRIIVASVASYVSYYFILQAFQMRGDPALVVAVRQISIPVSVILAAVFLGEPRFRQRFSWALLLALGVVIVIGQ